jgi:hypothetical protein
MLARDANRPELIRPDVNLAIMMDFPGGTITSDVGFFLLFIAYSLRLRSGQATRQGK